MFNQQAPSQNQINLLLADPGIEASGLEHPAGARSPPKTTRVPTNDLDDLLAPGYSQSTPLQPPSRKGGVGPTKPDLKTWVSDHQANSPRKKKNRRQKSSSSSKADVFNYVSFGSDAEGTPPTPENNETPFV